MNITSTDAEKPDRGQIEEWLQPFPEGVRKMLFAVIDRPDFALRVVKMALHLRQHALNKVPQYWEDLALLGRRLAPRDPEVRFLSERALRTKVPSWHFALVHDQLRNEAFRKALEYFVKPSTIVFEIGTGSGILAMMAARAGARHVYTCEMEGLLAEAAKENIRANGYADRITVIPKRSTDLVLGTDMPHRADLFVAEIVDNFLLGEKVLPFLEDARSRLLKAEAIILPSRIASVGALVGGSTWTRNCRVDDVAGFDLSAMNRLAPCQKTVSGDRELDDVFCAPFELFSFDLAHDNAFPHEKKRIGVEIILNGRVDGLVSWLRLDFYQNSVFENRPPQK
jgi:type II protein arginine methyltransferase